MGNDSGWRTGRRGVRGEVRRRWVAALMALGVALGAGVAASGCAEEGVAREQRVAEEFQRRLDEQSDAMAGVVQRFDQAVLAGVEELQASREALEALAHAEPVSNEVVAAVTEAVAAGVPTGEALRSARSGLEDAIAEVGRYRAGLATERAEARASDEGWLGLGGTALGMVLAGVPGGAGILAAVGWGIKKSKAKRLEGIDQGREMGLAEGIEEGAAVVRDSVKLGREADPEFDAMFAGDTVASRVMRASLDHAPSVAAVVRASSSQKPTRPHVMTK